MSLVRIEHSQESRNMKPIYFYAPDYCAYWNGEAPGTNLFRESLEKEETALESFKKLGLEVLLYVEKNCNSNSEYLVYTYDPNVALAFINELTPLNKKYQLIGIKDLIMSKTRQIDVMGAFFEGEVDLVPTHLEEEDYYCEFIPNDYPILNEDKPSEWDKIIIHLKHPISI